MINVRSIIVAKKKKDKTCAAGTNTKNTEFQEVGMQSWWTEYRRIILTSTVLGCGKRRPIRRGTGNHKNSSLPSGQHNNWDLLCYKSPSLIGQFTFHVIFRESKCFSGKGTEGKIQLCFVENRALNWVKCVNGSDGAIPGKKKVFRCWRWSEKEMKFP